MSVERASPVVFHRVRGKTAKIDEGWIEIDETDRHVARLFDRGFADPIVARGTPAPTPPAKPDRLIARNDTSGAPTPDRKPARLITLDSGAAASSERQKTIAAVGAPELIGFVGILDAQGSAQAALDLSGLGSRLSGFVGARLTLAAWVYEGGGNLMGSPSNPLDVAFR